MTNRESTPPPHYVALADDSANPERPMPALQAIWKILADLPAYERRAILAYMAEYWKP